MKLAIPNLAILLLLPLLAGCEDLTGTNYTLAQARQMIDNPKSADARRNGIATLATRWPFTHQPPYTNRYQQIAQHDPDFIVRAMAIRALNISRDASATKIFINALEDDNALVRLEAAKALANVPDPEAIPALVRRLQGTHETINQGNEMDVAENKDVRIAAADALRQYRTIDVARTLVGYLNESDFGVAWQSRQSLLVLTRQDLNYDQAAWLKYLVSAEKPFG
jgi:hypothetical protein